MRDFFKSLNPYPQNELVMSFNIFNQIKATWIKHILTKMRENKTLVLDGYELSREGDEILFMYASKKGEYCYRIEACDYSIYQRLHGDYIDVACNDFDGVGVKQIPVSFYVQHEKLYFEDWEILQYAIEIVESFKRIEL